MSSTQHREEICDAATAVILSTVIVDRRAEVALFCRRDAVSLSDTVPFWRAVEVLRRQLKFVEDPVELRRRDEERNLVNVDYGPRAISCQL